MSLGKGVHSSIQDAYGQARQTFQKRQRRASHARDAPYIWKPYILNPYIEDSALGQYVWMCRPERVPDEVFVPEADSVMDRFFLLPLPPLIFLGCCWRTRVDLVRFLSFIGSGTFMKGQA